MKLVLVSDAAMSVDCPGAAAVPALDYLLDPAWRGQDLRVLNLTRSSRYLGRGYYVSLLAEARGHRPFPDARSLHDLGRPQALGWLLAAAQRCERPRSRERGFRLAILRDARTPCPASNEAAVAAFRSAASRIGMETEVIGRDDVGRLKDFDGLFIRDNTFIQHYTYRFARRAAALGLAVIDDPDSILHCNNKVYLAELLPRHGIPIPATRLVHRSNLERTAAELGLPCVLKHPDSSLSLGVLKAASEAQLRATAAQMLARSELIVAQEYLPTEFDWRVGVLEGLPLFACKYHMVPGHWQIVRHVPGAHYEEGRTEAVSLDAVPARVVELAVRCARLIGDGFYGVDIKQVGPDDYRVIEINDNPNADAGNEDGAIGDALYRAVMAVFARRIAARQGARR